MDKDRTTILIADDNSDITEMISETLEEMDFHCLIASNGEEALNLLQKSHVDILITDILMPKMTGLDLIVESRKLQPHLHILAISGGGDFSSEESKQKNLNYLHLVKKYGKYEVLKKPFKLTDIINFIEKSLSQNQMQAKAE